MLQEQLHLSVEGILLLPKMGRVQVGTSPTVLCHSKSATHLASQPLSRDWGAVGLENVPGLWPLYQDCTLKATDPDLDLRNPSPKPHPWKWHSPNTVKYWVQSVQETKGQGEFGVGEEGVI